MALCYVDGQPNSTKNPLSKAHGRNDLFYLATKMLLVFLWRFSDSSVAKLLIFVLCVTILVVENFRKQPFHDELLQAIRSGIFTSALISAIVALLADVLGSRDSESIVPFVLLMVLLIPGFAMGAFLSKAIKQRTTLRIYTRFQNQVKEMRAQTGVASFAGVHRNENARRMSFVPGTEISLLDSIADKTAADPNALVLMRELYEAAFIQYPKDGFVHIQAALYLLAYGSETTMLLHPNETNFEKAEEILHKLTTMPVAFDIRFMTFVCEKQIEQSIKSKEVMASDLNVSSYVEILSREQSIIRLYAQFNALVLSDNEECRRLTNLAEELEGNDSMNTSSSDTFSECFFPNQDAKFPTTPANARTSSRNDGDSTPAVPEVAHQISVISELLSGAALDAPDQQRDISGFEPPPTTIEPESTSGGDPLRVTIQADAARDHGNIRSLLRRKSRSSSHGGSSQLSEGRENRRARAMRTEFQKRVTRAPQTYNRRLTLALAMILVLVSLSFWYSYSIFVSLNGQIDNFLLTTDMGRSVVATAQAVRLMSYFGHIGDDEKYQYWKLVRPLLEINYISNLTNTLQHRSEFVAHNEEFADQALPYLSARSSLTTGISHVLRYNSNLNLGLPPYIQTMNQYQIAYAVDETTNSLLEEDITHFQQVPLYSDRRVRFYVDNMVTFGDAMKAVADIGQQEFCDMAETQVMVLVGFLVAELALLGLIGFGVLLPLFTKTRMVQLRYLRFLEEVSKKTIDELLLQIDEQLEVLVIEEANDGKQQAKTKLEGTNRTLAAWKLYSSLSASILFLGFCCVSVVLPALIRLPVNSNLVQILNYTGGRKYYVNLATALAYEVVLWDNTTWVWGHPEMMMDEKLTQLEILHRNAVTGHGPVEITPTTQISAINELMQTEMCFSDSCDDSVRHFNASIGFTEHAITREPDGQILNFISVAREFLTINQMKATGNLVDDRLVLMMDLLPDILGGLKMVDSVVFEKMLPRDNAAAQSTLVALFVITMILSPIIYVTSFRRVVLSAERQMEILTDLLHMVPVTSGVSQKFTNLITSGGAALGDEADSPIVPRDSRAEEERESRLLEATWITVVLFAMNTHLTFLDPQSPERCFAVEDDGNSPGSPNWVDSFDFAFPPAAETFSSDLSIPNLPSIFSPPHSLLHKRSSRDLPYLPTASESSHSTRYLDRHTELLSLPNEVLLSVLSNLPALDMAEARGLSRRLKYLVEVPLSIWAIQRVKMLKEEVKEVSFIIRSGGQDIPLKILSLQARYNLSTVHTRKLPLLRHYRAFLTNSTSSELSELASHPNPPPELRVVAACLLGLHGSLPTTSTSPSSTAATDVPWSLLRRALLSPPFRRWLRTLPTIVDAIPKNRVALVDSIIVATSLTYERARASSIAAYRLLIVIAAALQVKHLGEEIEEAEGRLDRTRGKLEVGRSFAGYLGTEPQTLDAEEHVDEELTMDDIVGSAA
ncbi:hypothetical protein HDU93_001260 [Gonapodya sp. JEL0774]|nr:hypothetical protein HDU93_001260 [Gonapodya sp. JEL0774]